MTEYATHERNARTARTGYSGECLYQACTKPALYQESVEKAAISLSVPVCGKHTDRESLNEIAKQVVGYE